MNYKVKTSDLIAAKSKDDFCLVTMRSLRDLAEKESKLCEVALKDMDDNLIDPSYILDLTKSIHNVESQNIVEYVNRNKEILMNEHASVVKQNVMLKMKKDIEDMNNELKTESQGLRDDLLNFFEFIQSSYEAASNSFKRVVETAKENSKKVEVINDMQDKLFQLKSDVKHLEEELLECLMCYAFLSEVTSQVDTNSAKINLSKEFLRSFSPDFDDDKRTHIQKQVLEDVLLNTHILDPIVVDAQSAEDVTKSIELLKNSNMSLLQTNYFNKRSSKMDATELDALSFKVEKETQQWETKISNAQEDTERLNILHEKLEKELRDIENKETEKDTERENELKKLVEIFKLCTGSEAKIVDPMLMRAVIGNYIEELVTEINSYSKKKVKDLIKMLEAERKQAERKEEDALRAKRAQARMKRTISASTKTDHGKMLS